MVSEKAHNFESSRIVFLVFIVFLACVLEFDNFGFGFIEFKNNFVVISLVVWIRM